MRAVVVGILMVASSVHAQPSAPLGHPARLELTVDGGQEQTRFGGIAFAPDGGLFVAGTFFKKVAVGDKTLRAARQDLRDGFLARIEKDGKVSWLVRAGGASEIASVAAAPNGDVVIGGQIEYVIGKRQGPATDWRSRARVVRFDGRGTELWHAEFPAKDRSWIGDLAVAADNGVIAVGAYGDKTAFGQQSLDSITVKNQWGVTLPSIDAFVVRLRPDGVVDWVATGGGGERDAATAVAITPKGDIVVAGTIGPAAAFGRFVLAGPQPYPQQTRLSNPDWPFVARYSATGTLKSAIEVSAFDSNYLFSDAVVALDDDSVLVHANAMAMTAAGQDHHPLIIHVKPDGTATKRSVSEHGVLVGIGPAVIGARASADALVFEEHGIAATAKKTTLARKPDNSKSANRMGRFELAPSALVRAPDGRYAFAALVGAMTETPAANRTIRVSFGAIRPVIVISKALDELLPTAARP